eukprot:TRINITY_DN2015_c0_g2_i1.p1 TRINITY_DN2015_c0_g2~~TRINITY_DN2015_c0_g2_i1.p1  ORF type:complete len:582 (+),score=252.83 TRINITY_DN2015_c0_g2_i1:83-1828(+)
MPYTVFVASDVFGRKTNLELEFPFAPTLSELTKQVEYAFTAEQNVMRPGHNVPYQVSKFHVVDEVTDDWVEVLGANQLRNYCQLYSFQPHSTRYTESQGHIPPAKKAVMSYSPHQVHSPTQNQWYQSSSPIQSSPVHNSYNAPPASTMSRIPPAGEVRTASGHTFPENVGHDEKVKLCFDEIDANRDRVLQLDELQRTFRTVELEFTTATVDNLFRKADFDKDGVISMDEWRRFCELYPALLDSLYYRLKAHWEHLAETGRIDAVKAQRAGLEDRERQLQQNLDNLRNEADELQRCQGESDGNVQNAQDAARAAEDAAREAQRDAERARQDRADKERDLAAEKERERQAQMRASDSAREMEDAKRKAGAAQQAVEAAEAAERRLMQALQDAQREKERNQAIADQARAAADDAQARHNAILGDIPRTLDNARQALQDAERDLARADQRAREMAQAAGEANQRVSEAGRLRDDLGRQLQNARDRQEPAQRALDDARNGLSDHDRQIGEMEDRLTQEDARKRALLDEEKNIVEQEVRLREQREALEEKEGQLRNTHQSFFHNAGRQSPGRSRSPHHYSTPTKMY